MSQAVDSAAAASREAREEPSIITVAGVGASAGGLPATLELIRHLGPEPRIALVVVHHLDPAHESSLAEIVARATEMPVHTVRDAAPLEVNQVYVAPPGSGVVVAEGRLQLVPRASEGGLHLVVDQLFESLAADRTLRALGVVLSGNGRDGAVGVKALKQEGGVTFAQDGSAEYRGMPEAAISTGCIDFVLPPEGIARELLRIGERAQVPDGDDHEAFQRILSALRRSSGIDFTHYKHSTLRRRIERRMVVAGLASLRGYAELVERSAEERPVLSDEVLIHVTSFFRDPETFDALKVSVFPKLLENQPRDGSVRVWVPGCSSGEEVYSLAMCLIEFLSDAHSDLRVKLFGTDVSSSTIDIARAGRYSASIESEVSPGRLDRFFTKLDGSYQVRKDLRDLCVFARQDATRDPPFAGMDLISCRNLMIYLGTPLQDRILPIFHYALKEPGFLVLGTSESVRTFPGFAPIDAKNRIYARTSAAPRLVFDFSNRRVSEEPPESAVGAKASGSLDVQREADRLVLAEFAPPGVVVTDDLAIVQFRGRTGLFLEPTPGVPSFDLLRMVREELRVPLRQTIDEARLKQAPARRGGLQLSADVPLPVELEVIPFRVASTSQRFFVVLFRELALPERAAGDPLPAPAAAPGAGESTLKQELASTRDYLQSVIEQLEASNEELKAANEEIVSSNEELRSTNEELQMAKEELQATNEELRTVNDEMTVRNVEASRLNDDLTNVLGSLEVPIVIVGRDLRVRRYTPAGARAFHLSESDIGRPIAQTKPIVPAQRLIALISQVLERLTPITETVQDAQGRWHQLTVRPYLTVDNRIDGTVVTAFDIDLVTKRAQLLDEAHRYSESIVDTVRECLLVLDGELRVRSANRAFLETFGFTKGQLEGRALEELGRGEWNIRELHEKLSKLRGDERLEGFRVEREFEHAGRRRFVLSARHLDQSESLLLALDDVTERELAEEALRTTESGFREMLADAAESILMIDSAGKIVFANQKSATMFGYAAGELLGMPALSLLPDALPAEPGGASLQQRRVRERDSAGRRKDGTRFPADVILGSMQGAEGPLVVAFVVDVSERREAEKKLQDYQVKLQHMAFEAALAEERERRRIAVDLHDRIGQSLALAQIKLTSVRESISGGARDAVDAAVALVAQSVADTRTLIFDLSPPVLYDLGLKEAISWLVEELEKREQIRIEVKDDGLSAPVDDAAAALVFRAVRELLINVVKHARSRTASVTLQRADEHIDIEVEDQGVGFDPKAPSVRTQSGGFGLFSVREQIARLGGTVEVASAPEQGTRVSMRVPLKRESRAPDNQGGTP